MNRCLSITIMGHVQGVGFRYHALNKAKEIEINGFVRNQPDGTVYIEIEGDEDRLDQFIDWCRVGPRWANIDSIEVNTIECRNYSGFSVK